MALSTRKYKKGECITFKSTKGQFGGLSNMAPGYPIYVSGVAIKNCEALYQSLRFPDYSNVQQNIIKIHSPISAKKYGRTEIAKTREDWNLVRFKIMKFCIELKLFQNWMKFSSLLLATSGKDIVEYSDKDKVWGAIDVGSYYQGTNALGRLLMELRQKIENNNFELKFPEIENFKFLGKELTIQDIMFTEGDEKKNLRAQY